MIIWLASYPKSGNTWVRAIINSLINSNNSKCDLSSLSNIEKYPKKKHYQDLAKDFNDLHKIKKIWETSQDILNLDNKIKFLKTHHVNCTMDNFSFTNDSNTLGVIHIVRDPRNVITSIKNHFFKNSYSDSLKFMLNQQKIISVNSDDVPTLISSWNFNYKSWKAVNKNYLLIKYEDLISNLEKEVNKIINYLNSFDKIKINTENLNDIISSSSFENFQKMEEQGLFTEGALNIKTGEKRNFFYLGPKNKWQDLLNIQIKDEIEAKFKDEMSELGYI
tara:strand:- start:617 stop:1447 length:831 start_codon:yes stop_codon:yes gene_type:complete